MTRGSKKALLIPTLATASISVLVLSVFVSVTLINVGLPVQADIQPSITKQGNNFGGFVDINIPYNITNNSPAVLKGTTVNITLTLTGVQNIGWFPDLTILQISEDLPDIDKYSFVEGIINVNVSALIAVLAVADADLVIDVEVFSTFQLGPLVVPVHYIYRIQDLWKAPFSLNG
ncbi:MAG: hypothetical protein ACXAEU_01600 [Candidatus Hodarchaeales archaeon]|jgi:hypothetical protein